MGRSRVVSVVSENLSGFLIERGFFFILLRLFFQQKINGCCGLITCQETCQKISRSTPDISLDRQDFYHIFQPQEIAVRKRRKNDLDAFRL